MRFSRLKDAAWFRERAGAALSSYLRLAWKTSRFVTEPADIHGAFRPDLPVILTVWHGQHFMAPFLRTSEHRAKALISWHRDGDINAIAVEHLGIETIRGSGDPQGRFDRKGGVRAFIAMREALRQGWIVFVTADVPKIARVVGRGVVMLARSSGRPIYPVGIATSRRIELQNWDRSAINLPFSRGAMVLGEPVWVPQDAGEAEIAQCREAVERSLNAAHERAYAIVDRDDRRV